MSLASLSAGVLAQMQTAAGGGGGPGTDEIGDLQAAVTGGDSSILAFYSTNFNVTVDTVPTPDEISQWDDARGTVGYGPPLVQVAATPRLAWDGAAKVAYGDYPLDRSLATATSSKFTLNGAKTLIFIGTCEDFTAQTTDYWCSIASDASAPPARILGILQAGGYLGGNIFANCGNSGTFGDAGSGVADSTTRRMVVASKGSGSGTVKCQVPNQAVNAGGTGGTSPVVASGNNALAIFTQGTSSGKLANVNGAGEVRAVIVIDHQIDATETAAIFSWAQTYHGVTAA